MILVDTSAWVEFLRGTGSPTGVQVRAALRGGFATCDPVRMELLAGARTERELADVRGLLARGTMLPTTPADFEQAALLYRLCRQRGGTVRKLVDCLIAAVAIAADVPVLHQDRDFDVLAEHTPLRVA